MLMSGLRVDIMKRPCAIVGSFVDEYDKLKYDYYIYHNMYYKGKDNLVQELEDLGFVNPIDIYGVLN